MARAELKTLKIEARSATKLKEVSYKLENKVVELTQTLQRRTAEKKELQTRLDELAQAQAAWTSKYEEAETRARALQAEASKPTVPQSQYEEVLKSRDSTDARLGEVSKALADKEALVESLSADVARHVAELDARQDLLDSATARASDDAATVATLKAEISTLRASIDRSSALAVLTRNSHGGQQPSSPVTTNGGLRLLEGQLDPITSPGHAARKLSNGGSRRHSAEGVLDQGRSRGSTDQLMIDVRKAQSSQNRAVSVAAFAPDQLPWLKDGQYDTPAEQRMRMLENGDRLDEDVLNGLIKNLKLPSPSLQTIPTAREVVFPAHLIGLVTNEMWKFGLIPESERFLANVMQTIQHHVMVRRSSSLRFLCPLITGDSSLT